MALAYQANTPDTAPFDMQHRQIFCLVIQNMAHKSLTPAFIVLIRQRLKEM